MKLRRTIHRPRSAAFSLVEVIIALSLCTFVLLSLVGLLLSGLEASRDSEDQIQAANMGSLLISTRASAPAADLGTFALPATALKGAYGPVYNTPAYIGLDGKITTQAGAAYKLTCSMGTNATTGPISSQVYIRLSWPAQAAGTSGPKYYELFTCIPLR